MLALLYELVEGRHYRDSQKGRFSCSFQCSRQMPRCLKTMKVVASEVLTRMHTSCTHDWAAAPKRRLAASCSQRRHVLYMPLLWTCRLLGPVQCNWPGGLALGPRRLFVVLVSPARRGVWVPVSASGESLLGVLPQHGAQTGPCSPRSESSERRGSSKPSESRSL
jgi:hypothetical protein